MDVALVSHFADGERVIDIVDAGVPVAFGPGDSDTVEQTYCERIVDGRLPEVIPDAAANTEARRLPVTRELGIGAHVGVPIVLDNGEVFGTLCTYAHGARPDLDERAGTVLGLVADTIGRTLAADHGVWRAREGVRQRLDRLLSGSLLTMAYQPIVRLGSGALASVEALARFPAALGRTPQQWFDDAGSVDQAVELQLSAVYAAVSALPHLPAGVDLHVNLSPAVLVQTSSVLLQTVPMDRLVIELTEHEAVEDYAVLTAALAPLRAAGAKVAIDDAGAGFASFRHALLLKPEIIKLDISLVRGVDADPSKASLCTALAAFAHATGAVLVAEGVETPAEALAVERLGADLAQGYFFGRPGELEALPVPTVGRPAAVGAHDRITATDRSAETAGVASALFTNGASPATVAAALNARGLAAPSGRKWHAASVERLLGRVS